jgi:hypothetical protein
MNTDTDTFFNVKIQSTLQEIDGRGWADSHQAALEAAFERYDDKERGNTVVTNVYIKLGA